MLHHLLGERGSVQALEREAEKKAKSLNGKMMRTGKGADGRYACLLSREAGRRSEEARWDSTGQFATWRGDHRIVPFVLCFHTHYVQLNPLSQRSKEVL
jgi:hypothetical protein